MASHEHTFANPVPAGMAALAMACFTLFAVNTGQVSSDAAPVLACWMLGGFFVQFVAGIMELRNGELTGGNVFFLFGAFFMLVSAVGLMTKYILAQKGMPFDARIEGWAWLSLTLPLLFWTVAYLRNSTILMLALFVMVDAALLLISFFDMGVISKAVYAPIAGWLLLFSGLIAIYMSGAVFVNTAWGKTVFPIPGPLFK